MTCSASCFYRESATLESKILNIVRSSNFLAQSENTHNFIDRAEKKKQSIRAKARNIRKEREIGII